MRKFANNLIYKYTEYMSTKTIPYVPFKVKDIYLEDFRKRSRIEYCRYVTGQTFAQIERNAI